MTNEEQIWHGLGTPSRAILAVLHKDGEQLPSDFRANYDMTMDLGGGEGVDPQVRAVLNIEAAMQELDRKGLAETYYAGNVKRLRLTSDGVALMALLDG